MLAPLKASRLLRPLGLPFPVFAPHDSDASHDQSRKSHRILIIEDDLLIASQIEAALTEAGFDVIGVLTTGEEALQKAEAERPDLAIVDIRLAGDRDGVDTAVELFRSHGIRCIFASAYSDQEARRRAEVAAPLGWLQKPYTMKALTDIVRAATQAIRPRNNS
jgi:two-component system, response regulator PdtaR